MAQIRVRGIAGLLDIPDDKARDIKRKIETGEVGNDDFISLGQWSGEVGQITSILLPEERTYNNQWADKILQWQNERKRVLAMSERGKAQNALPMFNLLFWSITGVDPDQATKDKAVSYAESYFGLEPSSEKRMYPDITIWKELITPHQKSPTFFTDFHQGAFRVVENCIKSDIEDSGVASIVRTETKKPKVVDETKMDWEAINEPEPNVTSETTEEYRADEEAGDGIPF